MKKDVTSIILLQHNRLLLAAREVIDARLVFAALNIA